MEIWEIITITVMWFGSGLVLTEIALKEIDDHFSFSSARQQRLAILIGGALVLGPIFGLIGLAHNRMCGILGRKQ